MKLLLVLLAVVSGITQPAQSAMNAKVRESVVSPTFAAAIAYAVGATALAVLAATGLFGRADASGLGRVPWWAWLAGAIGAFQVTVSLVAIKEVSAAVLIACTVTGQLAAAVAIDHFGALGLERVPINGWRIGGVVLLVAGMLLVQKR